MKPEDKDTAINDVADDSFARKQEADRAYIDVPNTAFITRRLDTTVCVENWEVDENQQPVRRLHLSLLSPTAARAFGSHLLKLADELEN